MGTLYFNTIALRRAAQKLNWRALVCATTHMLAGRRHCFVRVLAFKYQWAAAAAVMFLPHSVKFCMFIRTDRTQTHTHSPKCEACVCT